MKLAWYKLPMVLVVLVLCLILALRIKGKIVASWILVLMRYNLRPKYYLFNKNDTYLRDIYLPELKSKHLDIKKAEMKTEVKVSANSFGIKELIGLRKFINNPDYTLSLKPDKRGGLYVALEQIQR